MSVAMARPISRYCVPWFIGPRRMNRNLVGTGTSVRSPSITACFRRMKAETWFSRNSTCPIITLDASAPGGSFLKKCWLPCEWVIDLLIFSIDSVNHSLILIRELTIFSRYVQKNMKIRTSFDVSAELSSRTMSLGIEPTLGRVNWLLVLAWAVNGEEPAAEICFETLGSKRIFSYLSC